MPAISWTTSSPVGLNCIKFYCFCRQELRYSLYPLCNIFSFLLTTCPESHCISSHCLWHQGGAEPVIVSFLLAIFYQFHCSSCSPDFLASKSGSACGILILAANPKRSFFISFCCCSRHLGQHSTEPRISRFLFPGILRYHSLSCLLPKVWHCPMCASLHILYGPKQST